MPNIFENLPNDLTNEFLEDLLVTKKFRIERIISHGHTTPENFWYDQETEEFVLLLKGEAVLLYENNEEQKLSPGDYLIIPAHKKHRVKWTSDKEDTIWLTIHF